MVKINLLAFEPGSEKAAAVSSHTINLKPASTALVVLSVIFLLLGGYLRVYAFFTKQRFETLLSEKAASAEMSKKAEALKNEYQAIAADYDFYSGSMQRDVIWSRKLGQLRTLLPSEIWFTRVFLQKKENKDGQSGQNSLLIKGGLVQRRNLSFIGTLSEFINHMKADPDFFSSFDSPSLTDLRTETWENTMIMTFSLELPFKKVIAKTDAEVASPKK